MQISAPNVLQRQQFEAQEQQMHYENEKKFDEKKCLSHLSPFSKKTPRL